MRRLASTALLFLGFIFVPVFCVSASEAISISMSPLEVVQGEPLKISIDGAYSLSEVRKIIFDGKALGIFMYGSKPTALAPVDLRKKPDTYKISVELSDGRVLLKDFVVLERKKTSAPLGIPDKLGGNTQASQSTLVSTLAAENQSFLNLRMGAHAFWKEKFRWPLASTTVTDAYGYSRLTGNYTIAHKGTDFRAVEGTKVYAMNRGVVRIAREYRNYGKTIVVDHGLGLQTFYMHLSKIRVNVGELVLPGQFMALSGASGYAENPHLHLTVRINEISIDPEKFMEFFR